MSGKQGEDSRNRPNQTGKSGNASGRDVKEARGPSYEQQSGKHPPNQIYKGPKDMHPPSKRDPNRQSNKG